MTEDKTAPDHGAEDKGTSEPPAEANTRTWFDLAQANQMLPLLRSIVKDAMNLSQEVSQTRARLEAVGLSHQLTDVDDIYSGELRSIEASTCELSERLSACLTELTDLGVNHNCDSIADGYVDFPSSLDGKKIHWCWNLQDPSVAHWHWVSEPCSMRRPLEPELVRAATTPVIDDEPQSSILA
jgi:hypothetical protein